MHGAGWGSKSLFWGDQSHCSSDKRNHGNAQNDGVITPMNRLIQLDRTGPESTRITFSGCFSPERLPRVFRLAFILLPYQQIYRVVLEKM